MDYLLLAQQVFPSKPLGCYGDGGACFTNDEKLAEIMKEISLHGQKNVTNIEKLALMVG